MESLQPVVDWFERQGWEPLPFQRQTWEAYLAGRSGLIQVPTGSGKTFAAVMGPIARMLADDQSLKGIHLLWLMSSMELGENKYVDSQRLDARKLHHIKILVTLVLFCI